MKPSSTVRSEMRPGLILLAVLLVGSYLIFTTTFRENLEEQAIEFKENLTWAIFQVQKELVTTLRLSEQVGNGRDVSVDDILLSFDIFVSRVNLVIMGDGFEELRQLGPVQETLDQLKQTIELIDKKMAVANEQPTAIAAILYEQLSPFEGKLQQISLEAIHYSSERNTERNAEIASKLSLLQVLFIGNLVLIGGVVFVAFRQALKAYRAAFEAEEQALERRFIEETAERTKLEALGSLAGGVAHEINTPAQFVTTNLEFLKEAFNDIMPSDGKPVSAEDIDYYRDEVPAAISQSSEGMRRIAEIVQAIKHFAHPEEGRRNQVSIADEIHTALLLTNNQTKHSVDVTTDIEAELPSVIGRPNELNQVLINLIMNATYAIEDSRKSDETNAEIGKIEVTAKRVDNGVEIRVHDNGPGVPVDLAKRIFDPFFTTKPVGIGTGQGLAICQRIIINTFNGAIMVDESMPKGGCFIIQLPVPELAPHA